MNKSRLVKIADSVKIVLLIIVVFPFKFITFERNIEKFRWNFVIGITYLQKTKNIFSLQMFACV